jgi:hypothetical protein
MAVAKSLVIQIDAPRTNTLVVVGQTINVGGSVVGKGGLEPVSVDTVTVHIGSSPPVDATLTSVRGPVPGATFHTTVQVPGPPGPQTIVVTAAFDNNVVVHAARVVNAAAGELTGVWRADDGGLYFLKQNVTTLWWVGMDGNPGLQRPGLTITNVFRGEFPSTAPLHTATAGPMGPVTGLGISGAWADVPRGTRMRSGTLTVNPIHAADGSVQQLQVVASSGGFTTTMLTRTLSQPQTGFYIQQVLDSVQKNVDGETLGQNLKAYKDHVVLFGHLTGDGLQNVQVNWTINDGRTYQAFICKNAGGDHDGDANTNMTVDRDKLDRGTDFIQPNVWSQGWERWVDPNVIAAKLDLNNNSLHLEVVMFGRAARCSEPERFDDPPLVPGWQEMDGNGVLVNGRPLNGLGLDPIAGLDSVPTRVVVFNGKPMSAGTPVRVTGALVLDCGHGLGSPCYDSPPDVQEPNQEIHPVYAIDVIDATAQSNLSGVWGDNFGMTYYVHHVADTVWWFGMGPLRDNSFGQVFRGTLKDGIIDGAWQDVPFGTGDSSGGLRLRVDSSKLRLVPEPQSALSDRRWLKLYDASGATP